MLGLLGGGCGLEPTCRRRRSATFYLLLVSTSPISNYNIRLYGLYSDVEGVSTILNQNWIINYTCQCFCRRLSSKLYFNQLSPFNIRKFKNAFFNGFPLVTIKNYLDESISSKPKQRLAISLKQEKRAARSSLSQFKKKEKIDNRSSHFKYLIFSLHDTRNT